MPAINGGLPDGVLDDQDRRMQIPGLGTVVEDAALDWYSSAPIAVRVLGDIACRFVVRGYNDDPAREDFHAAIRAFLALDRSVLEAATPAIYAYYRDVMDDVVDAGDDDWYVEIAGAHDVLDYVRLGDSPMVTRNPSGDRRVYISVECECAWEPEHGLQLVFRDGTAVTKVGPYNGHLTNAAAYGDKGLADVVYRTR